jgi:transcriptional regulator with XRE-family HTH domain
VSSPTLGERVADFRRQRGLSQRELAAEMRRSESWVSQVERDVQPVERLSILHALAQALGVSIRDLRPEAVPPVVETEDRSTDLDGLRLQLSGHPVLLDLFGTVDPDDPPPDLDQMRSEVDHAWRLAHESRYASLNDALTELLPRLEQTARRTTGKDATEVHALRARAYQAVSAAFARQDEADAAWVAADRAISAAELAGGRTSVIAGHFRLARAFVRLGRYDQAEHVTTVAIVAPRSRAEADDATVEELSLYGAMNLVQAVISAHESDRSRARQHLAEAEHAARRIGADRNDFDTKFGPTNVKLHRVAVAVDLGDAGEALDVAKGIDATSLSPERQVRLMIDVARAHVQRRHTGEAISTLLDAERLAPEHVRSHHLAKTSIGDLLDQFGRRPPAELLELARRCGATP